GGGERGGGGDGNGRRSIGAGLWAAALLWPVSFLCPVPVLCPIPVPVLCPVPVLWTVAVLRPASRLWTSSVLWSGSVRSRRLRILSARPISNLERMPGGLDRAGRSLQTVPRPLSPQESDHRHRRLLRATPERVLGRSETKPVATPRRSSDRRRSAPPGSRDCRSA